MEPSESGIQSGNMVEVRAADGPLGRVALQFGRPDNRYGFGEEIRGQLSFVPARDFAQAALGLQYRWRIHGRLEPQIGALKSQPVAPAQPLQAGRQYNFPFTFTIANGPATFHGHNQKLDWFIWPVLNLADNQAPLVLQSSETMLLLVPVPGLTGGSVYTLARWEDKSSGTSWRMVIAAFLLSILTVAIIAYFDLSIRDLFDHWWYALLLIPIGGFIGLLSSVYSYMLAELKLGSVSVTIGQEPNIDRFYTLLTIQPPRRVTITGLRMRLTIEEVTEKGVGTQKTVERKNLWQAASKTQQRRSLSSGEILARTLTVDLVPPGLIPGNPPPAKSSWFKPQVTDYRIEWNVTITIHLAFWFSWRKSYLLHVY